MPRPAAPGGAGVRPARAATMDRPKAAAKRQQHAVEQPGDAGRRLVLHEVEQGRDQREARHQEQRRRDEAHRMGEREGADAEAQHDQAVDARGEHGAERGHGVLVEALARQQGARRLAEAAADGGGPGRQQIAAVEIGKARRGDRHRERDRQQGMQRRAWPRWRRSRRPAPRPSGRACSSAPAARAPRCARRRRRAAPSLAPASRSRPRLAPSPSCRRW